MKYLGRISDPKDLVTKEYVDNGLGGLQPALTPGNNIDISGSTISATDTKYKANTSKLVTGSVGSASGWDAGALPTLGTAISADDITAWSAGSHSANIQLNVLISADVSGGTLTISSGSQSHSYTAPSLSYSPKTIPNVTGVGTLPSLTVTPTTVATGGLSSSGSGSSVATGISET